MGLSKSGPTLIGIPNRVVDVVCASKRGTVRNIRCRFTSAIGRSFYFPLVPPERSDDHPIVRRAFRFGLSVLLSVSVTAIVGSIVFAIVVHPQRRFTGYPPSVYMNLFLSCPSDGPCIREDTFSIDPLPRGCCTMLVTNGDGRGTDEVRSYDIFLNGE
jgi:hypothetical protein